MGEKSTLVPKLFSNSTILIRKKKPKYKKIRFSNEYKIFPIRGEKGRYFILIRSFWTFNILRRLDRTVQLYFEACIIHCVIILIILLVNRYRIEKCQFIYLSSGARKFFSLLSKFANFFFNLSKYLHINFQIWFQ